MSHRFYCPHLLDGGTVTLSDAESHHLTHVLRRQINDVVELFNGDGLVAMCRVNTIRKREVELEIMASRRNVLSTRDLTLATSVPKGDRFDWLIEKATELGVRRLIPITTSRSVVDPRTSKLDKLRQTVITACKQSGRNHLMEISPVINWSNFLQGFAGACEILIAHPHGALGEPPIPMGTPHQRVVVAIGPEGGFSDEEIQLAINAGAKTIHLGQNILRIETAALAVAARYLL